MKFWQLLSIFQDEEQNLLDSFSEDQWSEYLKHYKNIDNIVSTQRRDILDMKVDDQLLDIICQKSKKIIYYIPDEGQIYSYKIKKPMIEVSMLKAIYWFNHDSIEEAFEKSYSNVG